MAIQQAARHIVALGDVARLLAGPIVNQPVDFHLLLPARHVAQRDGAAQREIGSVGGTDELIAGLRQLVAHLPREREIAVARGTCYARKIDARGTVEQAVRVALLDAGIDGFQQLQHLRRGRAGGGLQHRGIAGSPAGLRHRRPVDHAVLGAGGIPQYVMRQHAVALQLGGERQLPVAGLGRLGERGHFVGDQRVLQAAGPERGIGGGQQRVVGHGDGEAGGRRMRQAERGGAGVAGEGAGQVATTGEG